uniref:Uncharacterized protein n=1 Tax=Aegilops tauschii subsp. strangulata TaxID=200361 RepID=A0A453FLU2_AEGTS
MIGDDWLQQVMPSRCSNQRADGPDDAELKAPISMKRLRDARQFFRLPVVIERCSLAVRGIRGRHCWQQRLGRHRGRAEDNAAAEGGAKVSAFHLRSTPSSMPSSPVGSSMRRLRSSLKERRTSEGEWWEMSPAGGGGEAGGGATERRETMARVGERIWPSAWMGLTMPPSTRRAMWASAPRPRDGAAACGEPAEAGAGSSGMTQSTRTKTESTSGTRPWKRRETSAQRPSALTSPMRLKTSRSTASGRRSNWSSSPSSATASPAAAAAHGHPSRPSSIRPSQASRQRRSGSGERRE